MSGWLLLTWDGAGNQVPMTALAQALGEAGHAVTIAGYAGQRSRFEKAGFEKAGFEFRSLPRADAGYPAAPPPEGWLPALVGAVWVCPAQLADVAELLADGAYDGVVADCLMFGALAGLEASSVPTAVLVHSAPGALCPSGMPMDQMLLPAVNAVRAEAGRPALERLWDAWTPFPALCTSVRELDPLGDQVPASFDYVGPLFDRRAPSGRRTPWAPDDTRPLVVVSFSTGAAWDQTSRIQRTLDALDDGRHRVLVTSGMADVTGVRVPSDAVVLPWLPHAEVLPHAAAIVTHAGHGTVAAARSPTACRSSRCRTRGADQPALAHRTAVLGAGVALDGETGPVGIAAAVRTVIEDPSYRAAATALAGRVTAAPGPAYAVGRLERLVRAPGRGGDASHS
ncbi:glycosyltransferase [Spirillospora sp. CA-128828]|uniref:glycosyltransferase n=1 Tax=Spirillospora sp. CA-128828 TaxID=3240033 RepID=UPI003D925A24